LHNSRFFSPTERIGAPRKSLDLKGSLKGRDQLRHYWQRQWAELDPQIEPRAFSWDADGHIVVTLHQIVRDLTGKVLSDQMVTHVYAMQDGLVLRMEIRK
jgi:hypothetical protein